MPVKFTSSVKRGGPFFTKDPAKTFRQNVRMLMEQYAELGEADAKGRLQAGESGRAEISSGVRPARVSAHVVGRTVNARSGKQWLVTARVSVSPKGLSSRQATALMAAASRIEGREHVLRKTASQLRSTAKANYDLLKGIR